MVSRVVYQDGDLLGTNFLSSVAKDKQHGVNDVTFAATIGSHDRGEAFMERAQRLFAIV